MTVDSTPTVSPPPPRQPEAKELFVFDFDETVVDCNSDTFINVLFKPDGRVPEEVSSKFNNANWTSYMRAVFEYLHAQGVTRSDYERVLKQIQLIDGLHELISFMGKRPDKYDMIVVSDANTFFIETVLENYGLREYFTAIFTNPAHFDPATGCLCIQEYQFQDWCKLSELNMCKGYILEEFIKAQHKKGQIYSRINYAGDGKNDFCPSLRLGPRDRTFPRAGFKLDRLLTALINRDNGVKVENLGKREAAAANWIASMCDGLKLKCEAFSWKSGRDILAVLDRPPLAALHKSLGSKALVHSSKQTQIGADEVDEEDDELGPVKTPSRNAAQFLATSSAHSSTGSTSSGYSSSTSEAAH